MPCSANVPQSCRAGHSSHNVLTSYQRCLIFVSFNRCTLRNRSALLHFNLYTILEFILLANIMSNQTGNDIGYLEYNTGRLERILSYVRKWRERDERRRLPSTHLTGLCDVHRLARLRHVTEDTLAPWDPYYIIARPRGDAVGARVDVEHLRHETSPLFVALDEEERAAVSVEQDADVDEDPVREALRVKVMGYVLDDLEEEVSFVDRVQFSFQVDVLARVRRQVNLRQRREDSGSDPSNCRLQV